MDYPQDLPMNYRRKVPYQGSLSDLLSAPGYAGLQQNLVKVEQDKLQRELDLRNTPQWQELDFLNKAPERMRFHENEVAKQAREREMLTGNTMSRLQQMVAKQEAERAMMEQRKYKEQQDALAFARQLQAAEFNANLRRQG